MRVKLYVYFKVIKKTSKKKMWLNTVNLAISDTGGIDHDDDDGDAYDYDNDDDNDSDYDDDDDAVAD